MDDEILRSPCVVDVPHGLKVCAEIECSLRLGANLEADRPEKLFDSWCWSVELPATAITNMDELPLEAWIADRCSARFLVLGEARPYTSDAPNIWEKSRLTIFGAGRELASGKTSTALAWPPQENGKTLVNLARKFGFTVAPGQWIATGSLIPCVPLESGEYKVQLDGATVCQFTINQK